MQLTPVFAIHLSAALAATAIGPVPVWARKGPMQRPLLHRAFGLAFVTLMLVTAISALFIRDLRLPNAAGLHTGYTPIHLFVPLTLFSQAAAFIALAQGQIALHRQKMTSIYSGACLIAGAFTLLHGRCLGQLLWSNFS